MTKPEAQDLEQQLKELKAARDSAIADLQRVAADFDNYRKRTARDQEALVARAHERLVKELLPVLDDLERALDAAAEHEEAAGQPPVRDSGPVEGVRGNREVPPGTGDPAGAHEVFEGVRLVHRELSHVLQKEGLIAVDTEGKFDPHEHEALLTQPSDVDEGAILEVIQKGYRLGDRVLRPARVVVASAATTQGPVRDSGPGEGARGNREAPPASDEAHGGDEND